MSISTTPLQIDDNSPRKVFEHLQLVYMAKH